MSKQSRCFQFTLNNYVETDCPEKLLSEIEYACWGEEEAPNTGTPHLQGVIYFQRKKTLASVIKSNYFDGFTPHFELCRGTLAENLTYVQKDGIVHEFGVKPADPGTIGGRMEVDRWKGIRETLAGPTFDLASIADQYPMEAILHADRLEKFFHRTRPVPLPRPTLQNFWIVGATGVGKTQKAKTFGEYYIVKTKKCEWFTPRFRYEPVMILEELTPGKLDFDMLSSMSDHDPFPPPYKGGFFQDYRPAIVVVTSNYTLEECYCGRDTAAVARRFKVIQM